MDGAPGWSGGAGPSGDRSGASKVTGPAGILDAVAASRRAPIVFLQLVGLIAIGSGCLGDPTLTPEKGSSDGGTSDAVASADGACSGTGQPQDPCAVDSDCGNAFLTCVPQMVSACRDPDASVAGAGCSAPWNQPVDLPLCPAQEQLILNLCAVRYQRLCQVDTDCGPDGFTCDQGNCTEVAEDTCSTDAECPGGWSCYAPCPCGDTVGTKRCYPPFAEFGCPICIIGTGADGG